MARNKGKLKFITTNHNVSIWPLCMTGEMIVYHLRKIIGENIGSDILAEWKNKINRWAVDPDRFDSDSSAKMIRKIENNPKWAWKMSKLITQYSEKLNNYSEKVFRLKLESKGDREILKYYLDYCKLFIEMYTYAWFPNIVEGKLNQFSGKIEELIRQKNKKKYKQYTYVLTIPTKFTNREKERMDLLKIIKQILKNKDLQGHIIKKKVVKLNYLNQAKFEKIYKLLTSHWNKYCWISFNYDGPALSQDYFFKEALRIIKSKVDPQKEIVRMKNEKKITKSLQKKYAKELSLKKNEKLDIFVNLARELIYIKDYRKDALFKSYYHIDKLIREIGKRLFLSPVQVKHILPQEMERTLLKRKFNVDEINKRIKYSVITYKKLAGNKIPKNPINIYVGKDAEKIVKAKIAEEKIQADIKTLEGQAAFLGKVQGRARLIFSVEDIKKMKKGDVLVSHSTNPNLLPAMKKAGAIITDIGGITCHAAIVARELKIPCIIGTKFATKVIRDNQRVMVDANFGVIKILG